MTRPRAEGGALPTASPVQACHEAGCDCSDLRDEGAQRGQPTSPSMHSRVGAGNQRPPPSQRHNFILQVRRLPHREVKGQRRCHTERERGRREPGNKKIGIFSFPRRKRLAFLQGTNVIAKSSKNKPKKTQKPQGPSREFWRKSASKKGYLWERGHCDPETQAPSPRSGWNPWE